MDAYVHYVKGVKTSFQDTGVLCLDFHEEGSYSSRGHAYIFVWPEDLEGFVKSLEETLIVLREKVGPKHGPTTWDACQHPDCVKALTGTHIKCPPCDAIDEHYRATQGSPNGK